jgi:hypothetical protein
MIGNLITLCFFFSKDLWADASVSTVPSARSNLIGLAYYYSVCTTYPLTIIEDRGGLRSIHVNAHLYILMEIQNNSIQKIIFKTTAHEIGHMYHNVFVI